MQNTYAQNKEDLFVIDYFGDFKGVLLEIGANDGITLSNSKLLIENGWKADLIEPGYEPCYKLVFMYIFDDNGNANENVKVWDYGIGEKNERVDFWESDNHIPNGKDIGLVSTTNFEETKRWPNVKFTKRQIMLQTFEKHCQNSNKIKFDFISIDCEGSEWSILQQIDLDKVGCKCLCIEWNSKPELFRLFRDYCGKFGLHPVHQNNENLIFVK